MYYGWRIVANSVVGLALGWSVLGLFSFGLFLVPLEAEFGWNRETISVGFVIMSWTSILTTVLFGGLVDRFGVRPVMLPSVAGLSLCLAAMYFLTDSLPQFYLMLFAIVFVGGATSPVCYSRVLVDWFDRRRGLALGIGLAGVGVGNAIIPGIVSTLIAGQGWRMAYVAMAVLVIVINLPVTWFLMRDRPTAQEAKVEMKEDQHREDGSKVVPIEVSVSEVWSKPAFWTLIVAFTFIGFANSAGLTHQFPLMIGRGVDPGVVALAGSLFGVSIIGGRIVAGFLMDKFFAPIVAGLFILLPATALALYAVGLPGNLIVIATVLFGIGVGAEFDVISMLVSRYFGRLSFGKIYALVFAVFQGAAIGAWVVGRLYDQTGSYSTGFWLVSGSMAAGAITLFLLPAFPSATLAASGADMTNNE
jgi:MFS family permease